MKTLRVSIILMKFGDMCSVLASTDISRPEESRITKLPVTFIEPGEKETNFLSERMLEVLGVTLSAPTLKIPNLISGGTEWNFHLYSAESNNLDDFFESKKKFCGVNTYGHIIETEFMEVRVFSESLRKFSERTDSYGLYLQGIMELRGLAKALSQMKSDDGFWKKHRELSRDLSKIIRLSEAKWLKDKFKDFKERFKGQEFLIDELIRQKIA